MGDLRRSCPVTECLVTERSYTLDDIVNELEIGKVNDAHEAIMQ